MSLATGVTLMGRRQAESLMESTVTITRKTPETTDANGVVTPGVPLTIYAGKCRLRITEARPDEVAVAGQSLAKQSPILSIPVTATGSELVRVDDDATVTSPLDPAVITLRIAGMHSQTHSTARRFPVEVTS